MKISNLRRISYIALFSMILLLKFYSKLTDNVVLSITLIMLFLILFTFIFTQKDSPRLKILTIIFSFIVLPLFVASYIGGLSYFSNPLIAATLSLMLMCCVISIVAIFKLDYAELKWE